MAAVVTYGGFELVAKGSKTKPVLLTVVTQAHCESSPRSTGMARNQWLTTNKPRSETAHVLQYSVLQSELHDPVDSQSQLESISPPVGRATTLYMYVVALLVFRRFNVRLNCFTQL